MNHKALAWGGVLVAIVVLYWSAWFGADVGRADFPGHLSLLASLDAQLDAGTWFPLWTSDWNAGSSVVFWYLHPLNSSYWLLPFADAFGLVQGVRIGNTLCFALAALSMYGFGFALTRSLAAAFVGALVYVLHPSVSSFVGQVGQIHQPIALALLPLLFWAWMNLAREASFRNGVLAAIASALLFYDMERFWLTAPYAFALYLFVAAAGCKAGSRLANAGGILFAALATGAGMALLVAFPTLPAFFERPLLQWHDVATIDVFRRYYSFPHLLALVDRGGAIAQPLRPLIPQEFASLPGQWYQGVVALGFVGIGALLASRRESEQPHRAGLCLALMGWLVALLVAFGVYAIGPKHWTLISGLFDREIGFGLGLRLTVAAGFVGLFVLAALRLLAAAVSDLAPQRRSLGLALAVLAVAVLLFTRPFVLLADNVFIYSHLRAPSHFAFPALPFLLGTAACLVTPGWMGAVRTRHRTMLLALVVTLHLFDVLPYRFRSDWTYDAPQLDAWRSAFGELESRPAGRVLDTHHYNPMADMLTATATHRDMAWSWLSWSSTREIGDLIKTGFFDSMRIARMRPDVREANTQTAAQLAALANVRFVSRIAGISPPMPSSPWFEEVVRRQGVEIYENKLALPYLQFYPEVALLSGTLEETVPTVGALAQRGIASFVLPEQAGAPALHVDHWKGEHARRFAPTDAGEVSAALARAPIPPSRMEAPCRITERRTVRVALDCDFDQPGVLVMAEAWFPNWQVVRNQETAPALRLNHAFQGTEVEAGAARIEFVHEPSTATRVARPISLLAWLAALISCGFTIRAMRNRP